jgi:hypothetical protein
MMPDHSKTVLRVAVSAPKRGRLCLEWTYEDGSSKQAPASVAAIHKVLAQIGHRITAEALAQIAFCGGRMIFTRRSMPEAGVSATTTSRFT